MDRLCGSDRILGLGAGEVLRRRTRLKANRRTLESAAYFGALFERRRREPRDDLITLLVRAEEEGDRLTTTELSANVTLLFAAGHETTVSLIGNGLLSLLRHPEQRRMLRDDPERD